MFNTFNFMAIIINSILGGPYYPTLPLHTLISVSRFEQEREGSILNSMYSWNMQHIFQDKSNVYRPMIVTQMSYACLEEYKCLRHLNPKVLTKTHLY